MRWSTVTLAAAVTSLLTAACVSTGSAGTPTPTRTMIPRPLVERELASLLLSPEQVNVAMGTTGMAVTQSQSVMSDNSATMSPPECLAIDGAAEASVYANSGHWAERDASLNNGDDFTHYLKQAVVLFPTVEMARTFFDASAGQWPACHDYTHSESGTEWTAGQIVNTGELLSTVATQQDAGDPGWTCGRALAVRNNIVVDINTCSANPADSAARIAGQIADDVASRW